MPEILELHSLGWNELWRRLLREGPAGQREQQREQQSEAHLSVHSS